MKKLHKNWITEKHLDFEYKKYILLAYLESVSKSFSQSMLYPYFSDLKEHYNDLTNLQDCMDAIFDGCQKNIAGFDFEQMAVLYNKTPKRKWIDDLDKILEFSLSKITTSLKDGETIFDFLQSHIHVRTVGIAPLNNNEGYMFLTNVQKNTVMVYSYVITIFDKPDVHQKKMYTQYLVSYNNNLRNTNESIKRDLIKGNKDLPNPATYSIETDISIPVNETMLPIAKQLIGKHISETSIN